VSDPPPAPSGPKLFEFPPPGFAPAGNYRGVNLFFEIAPGDLPDVEAWIGNERDRESGVNRTLPPIQPEIAADGAEIYRVRDLHRVEFRNGMFEVGGYHYPRAANARLYTLKPRRGNFSFTFRGQTIVVPSDVPWTPSIYYHFDLEEAAGRRPSKREYVDVGLATIETVPESGLWLVDGVRYIPDPSKPLELRKAVHAEVAR
jgi:hypothetical protein